MIWLITAGMLVVVCFGGVILFGAPYLPTLTPQIKAALELADLPAGGTLLELGCGDGKVLLAAARAGYTVVGYELNPLLVLVCRWRCRRYGRQVRVIWGDFWRKPWPPADAIFVFLLTKYMKKLDTKVMQYSHKPVNLVSFAFQIPVRPATTEKQGVYLYKYR